MSTNAFEQLCAPTSVRPTSGAKLTQSPMEAGTSCCGYLSLRHYGPWVMMVDHVSYLSYKFLVLHIRVDSSKTAWPTYNPTLTPAHLQAPREPPEGSPYLTNH